MEHACFPYNYDEIYFQWSSFGSLPPLYGKSVLKKRTEVPCWGTPVRGKESFYLAPNQ